MAINFRRQAAADFSVSSSWAPRIRVGDPHKMKRTIDTVPLALPSPAVVGTAHSLTCHSNYCTTPTIISEATWSAFPKGKPLELRVKWGALTKREGFRFLEPLTVDVEP